MWNKPKLAVATLLPLLAVFSTELLALETVDARVERIESFSSAGHLWVRLSANSNCPTPNQWIIIERWDNQAEPLQTYRKQMYQMLTTAFATGMRVRIVGSACYLNSYLLAEQVAMYE